MVEIRTFAKFSIISFATIIALVDIGVLIFNCLTFSHWFSHLYASIVYLSRQAFLICFFRDMENRRYDNSLCLGFSALISLLVVISSLLATSFLSLYIQILVGVLILVLMAAIWLYSWKFGNVVEFDGQVLFHANNPDVSAILMSPGRSGDAKQQTV